VRRVSAVFGGALKPRPQAAEEALKIGLSYHRNRFEVRDITPSAAF
jgi:hypothetical protein